MTVTPGDGPEFLRQRTRDQLELLGADDHGLLIVSETDDPADFTFICDRTHVLLPPEDPDPSIDAVSRLEDYFGGRQDDFDDVGGLDDGQPRTGLSRRYVLPSRRVSGDQDLLRTLSELDGDPAFGPGFATPDHLVHIAGKGTCCPATEPEESGLDGPWPPLNSNANAGAGVSVVVIDTGWYPPAQTQVSWLSGVTGEPEPVPIPDPPGQLREYAGHGTFVAGLVRAMAPACDLHVLNFAVDKDFPGGGVLESQLVAQLDAALAHSPLPDLINLSAGCPTRLDLPLRSFEVWRGDLLARTPESDLVLVAAAGNNSSPGRFYPASFDWAVGVGALDYNGKVSSFSNFGLSVDVFALGRNLVNAFPMGDYTCQEKPNAGDRRKFTRMLARWSGTSFAAPLVTGLIAAEMSSQQPGQRSARAARDAVLASGVHGIGAVGSLVTVLAPPQWP